MSRRRGKSSNSTLSIMIMIAFLLAVIVGLAILLAPQKEPAPPVSSMHYETRPSESGGEQLPLAPYREDRRDTAPPLPSGEDPTPDVVAAENTENTGPYEIRGTVVDGRTQAPVADVRLVASRVPSESEERDYKERDAQIIADQDTDAFSALIEEKQRIWADAGGQSDAEGRFSLAITHPGDYKISALPRAHLKQVVEKQFVGDTHPTWEVALVLEVGATISGRVFDGSSGAGIGGLTINATQQEVFQNQEATTSDDGTYEIAGLSPGEYTVVAAIEETAYRVTRELPFKRATLATPTQAIQGLDFKLDRGGVVWGYITGHDDAPVGADVVLCTSESVLTQALSAMVRKAPPLHTRSRKDDGYYELVGVPLNEPWRLYATADERAPQLAEAFLLTDRQKEARLDIFMFAGTNVYGQVVDDKGAGVPEAQVMCIPGFGQLLAPMDRPQAMRETSSDAEGYFELRELPAGNYQVMAQKQGYKFALRGEPLDSDGYHEIKNFRVVLSSIEAGRYKVFGTVRDDSGTGLSGARVTLSGLGTDSLQGIGRETFSGSGGAFEFDGVEIGTYMLRAEAEGYSPKTQGRVLFDEPNYINMRASGAVSGRVLAKNTSSAPEGGYTVRATLVSGGDDENDRGGILAIMESATSADYSKQFEDPQGYYQLELPSGTWQLEGRAGEYTPARRTVTVESGQTVKDVDLILTQDGGVISGRVVISDGTSPQGTLVSLIEAGSASQALSTLAAGASGELPETQVSEDGAFEFERLPEGTYHAVARHPSYPQAMSESIPLAAGERADGVEVRLGPGGTLEGYVYRNGRPVTGSVVTLVAGGAPYTGTSDEQGYYEIRNIPEGEYEVFAGDVGGAVTGGSIGGQGYPVIIANGLVTRQNFGDANGVALEVTVEGRSGFIAATLNPPGAPVYQGDVELGQLTGYRSYVYGNVIHFEDIPIGEWQLDLYAGSGLTSTTLNWVGTELVSMTGEAPELSVVVVAH